MKHAQKGFTLIEIMIVVAIIAILAAVAIPNFISYRKTSQANACKANLKSIETAAEAYEVSKSGQTITTVNIKNDLVGTDGSGFLKAVPTCPAGGTYAVTKDATTGAWKATCTGAQPAHPTETTSTEE